MTMKQFQHQHQHRECSKLRGQESKSKSIKQNMLVLNLNTISLIRLFLIGAFCYPIIAVLLMNHVPPPSMDIHKSIQLLRYQEKRSNDNGNSNTQTPSRQRQADTDTDNKSIVGASACLLVNDENPRLPEWIAYHYNILPLRSLTVAVDPSSRSSPLGILQRWNDTGLMEMQLWNDDDYLYETADDGTSKKRITVGRNLEGHRMRQTHFMTKCMADFKGRKKEWVLLIDVDEYITFNRIDATSEHEEPDFPTDEAPDGIPTLIDWTFYFGKDKTEGSLHGWVINHTSAHPYPYEVDTESLISLSQVQPGGIVTDLIGNSYFLRDDRAIRDSTALDQPPDPMPTLKYVEEESDDEVCGEIYGDMYDDYEDGEEVCIEVDVESPGDGLKTSGANFIHGGHVVEDIKHRRYFLEKEQALWPKRLAVKDAKEARERLPRADERKTILDVLKEESNRYGEDTMGPCVMMPRLRYGSFEGQPGATTSENMAPDEINATDFLTLRYRWHQKKGSYAFGKTMIDVRRIPIEELQQKAVNVHAPLLYFCPRQVWFYNPQYATYLFRVNHYVDSFEAYSYRNDVRVDLRQSADKYDTLARNANYSIDTEASRWLQEFVQDVGNENTKLLLAGAGSFPRLDSSWNAKIDTKSE